MGEDLLSISVNGEWALYMRHGTTSLMYGDCAAFLCDAEIKITCSPHCCDCAVFKVHFQTDKDCFELGTINCNNADDCVTPTVQVIVGQSLGSVDWDCPKFRIVTTCQCGSISAEDCTPRDGACGGYGCHSGIERVVISGPQGVYTANVYYTGDDPCPDIYNDIGWIYFDDFCCNPVSTYAATRDRSRPGSAMIMSGAPNLEHLLSLGVPEAEAKARIDALAAANDHKLNDIDTIALDVVVRPDPPTLAELAANFSSAMARWAKAGFKTVEREEFDRRTKICMGCDLWEPNAYLGLGRCRKCGCAGGKRWLATEKCPIGKW